MTKAKRLLAVLCLALALPAAAQTATQSVQQWPLIVDKEHSLHATACAPCLFNGRDFETPSAA